MGSVSIHTIFGSVNAYWANPPLRNFIPILLSKTILTRDKVTLHLHNPMNYFPFICFRDIPLLLKLWHHYITITLRKDLSETTTIAQHKALNMRKASAVARSSKPSTHQVEDPNSSPLSSRATTPNPQIPTSDKFTFVLILTKPNFGLCHFTFVFDLCMCRCVGANRGIFACVSIPEHNTFPTYNSKFIFWLKEC